MKTTYIFLLAALVSGASAASADDTTPLTGSLAGHAAAEAPLVVQNPGDLTFAVAPDYHLNTGAPQPQLLGAVEPYNLDPNFKLTEPPRPPVPIYQPRVESAAGSSISPGTSYPRRNKDVTEIGGRYTF